MRSRAALSLDLRPLSALQRAWHARLLCGHLLAYSMPKPARRRPGGGRPPSAPRRRRIEFAPPRRGAQPAAARRAPPRRSEPPNSNTSQRAPPTQTARSLYLIDAKAQVYRLSHGYGDPAAPAAARSAGPAPPGGAAAAAAAPGADPSQPPAPAGAGEEDSLVTHGFVNVLLNLFAHKPPPTHMAVVVDAPGATFRRVARAAARPAAALEARALHRPDAARRRTHCTAQTRRGAASGLGRGPEHAAMRRAAGALQAATCNLRLAHLMALPCPALFGNQTPLTEATAPTQRLRLQGPHIPPLQGGAERGAAG